MEGLVDFVRELGASAVLSSHLLSDVEQICDYLVVLTDARVRVAGPVGDLLAGHRWVSHPEGRTVVRSAPGESFPASGNLAGSNPVSLEDMALAYMSGAVMSEVVAS